MENIEWDKLEKTRVERVVSTTFIEKILPEGIYVCPQCYGEGKVITVHRMFPPHKYGTCGMCRGTGEIRKCPVCNINSIPNYGIGTKCQQCFQKRLKERKEEFDERVKKGETK